MNLVCAGATPVVHPIFMWKFIKTVWTGIVMLVLLLLVYTCFLLAEVVKGHEREILKIQQRMDHLDRSMGRVLI